METNVRYTIAGLFVIILVSFMTLGIIWLSAGLSVETYDYYNVFMKESVSGLAVDAAVEFNGVSVGTVKSIKINKKDPELVELLLRIRSSTPISEGTTATLNMRGLTGVTFIALRDKATNRTPLRAKPGEPYPVITTTPSLLMRFDQALTKLNESFHDVSVSVHAVSAQMQKLLDNENLQNFHKVLRNLTTVTQKLAPLIQNGYTTIDTFNRQTLPTANQAISNMNTMMDNMSAVSIELKQNPSVFIRGKSPQPLGPGEK